MASRRLQRRRGGTAVRYFLSITLFFIFIISCYSQSIPITDTIYEQQHNQINLRFTRTSTNTGIEWKTILTNRDGKELTLHSDSIEKNLVWEHYESVGESPIDLYNIAGSYSDGKNLYVIYNRFGQVFIVKYTLEEAEKLKKEEKTLLRFSASGSFGHMVNQARFIKIYGNIYFSLYTGHSFTGTRTNIFRLNPITYNIKQIYFKENPVPVKVISVDNFGKVEYEQTKRKIEYYENLNASEKTKNKSIAPTENEIKRLNTIEQYLEKPFCFKVMDINEEKYKEENINLQNTGITDYPLFGKIEDSHKIDKAKIKYAEQYIKEVLAVCKEKDANKIQLLDFIYDSGQENIIYFFCQKNTKKVEIIRYNNYNNEWLLGDYKEEEVEQP